MADKLADSQISGEKWVDRFLRFGLIAKGVVYCLVGMITLMASIGVRGDEVSKTDVLELIYEQPFGRFLLIIIAIGLFGYVTLRFFQAFKDIDGKGSGVRGIFSRIGYGISGLLYLALGLYAGKLILNMRHGDSESQRLVISKALAYPWGQWVIGIIGLIIMGNGIYQVYRAVSGKFMKKIRLIKADFEKTVRKAGVTGYISRGVVLIIIGYLIFHAAITSNARQVQGGTDGAFEFIENIFGSFLLAVVSVGMVGYGLFMFVRAKYQRITIE
jgi:hypothetical protein